MFCAHIPKLDSSASCFIQSRTLAVYRSIPRRHRPGTELTRQEGLVAVWLFSSAAKGFQFGIFTCPPAKVISVFEGGVSAIGGTLAAVIGGAPTPRGVV